MSDKLPMTREQIAEEVSKCFPLWENITIDGRDNILATFEHVLRIGTTELREENKRLRVALVSKGCDAIFCEESKRSCDQCQVHISAKPVVLKKDADNFFKDGVPF